jgi:hypothetical protein
MYTHYWNQFLPQLARLERILSTPYSWNSKERRFGHIRNLSYVQRFRFVSVLFAFHMLFVCWNLLQTLRNEANILLMIFSTGFTFATGVITVVRWMYQNPQISGIIVKRLNATVDFQRQSIRPAKTEFKNNKDNLEIFWDN